jgi:hypothetical protein
VDEDHYALCQLATGLVLTSVQGYHLLPPNLNNILNVSLDSALNWL